MRLISYAQNFEDVMLWRALKNISQGYYIDIGAHHPRHDSVSRLFYEHSWRGLHVEPLSVYCEALIADRPEELVMQAAVAERSGMLKFFEIPETGISTANEDIAAAHRSRGFNTIELDVPCITLEDVFAAVPVEDVHWLKIDVEGFEERVLASWGEAKIRPWIIVVESTLPLTQDESHQDWEFHLVGRDYKFCYFDGLNRFYVAAEHSDLSMSFGVGPNVFDQFELSGESCASFCNLVNEKLAFSIDEITRLAASLDNALKQVELLNKKIEIIAATVNSDSL